jgi:putative glutamine amidotransferase
MIDDGPPTLPVSPDPTPPKGRRLRIGVSACFFHADPKRNLFKGKTLLYAEESMLTWLMSAGVLPVLVPRAGGLLGIGDFLEELDGLVLQGGSDMSPSHYGEEPVRPEWAGDAVRDVYEIELVRLCLERRLPLLGVCRGAQVLNVALGGSLYQDVETIHPERRVHRNWEIYDEHAHEIAVEPGSWLAARYGDRLPEGVRVNSVHHQALRNLGRGLVIEARSVPDGVVEAVRYGPAGESEPPFAYGVQWHPEFMKPGLKGFIDPSVLLAGFLGEIESRSARP